MANKTCAAAVRLGVYPEVLLIPCGEGTQPPIGVVCENWKDEPFPNAALVMQELCDKGRKFSNTCSQEVPGWMHDSHHFLTFLCDRSLMKCVLRTRLHTSLRTRPHHVLRFIASTIKPQGECQLRLCSPSIERHAVTTKARANRITQNLSYAGGTHIHELR